MLIFVEIHTYTFIIFSLQAMTRISTVFNMFFFQNIDKNCGGLFFFCFASNAWSLFSTTGKVLNQNMAMLVHKHFQYTFCFLETLFSNLPFFDFPKYVFWTGHTDQMPIRVEFIFVHTTHHISPNSKKYLSFDYDQDQL